MDKVVDRIEMARDNFGKIGLFVEFWTSFQKLVYLSS